MNKYLLCFLLTPYSLFSQTSIGLIEGAELLKYKTYYEVIFKTQEGKFSSFYIENESNNSQGFLELKKYVFNLFKNQKEEAYLLQFKEDSILLSYKDAKVQMVKWTNHYSEDRVSSLWFSYEDYLKLFGLASKKKNF